jgi:predicted amidohydrolase
MSKEITLGEFLCGILPRLRSNRDLPQWPPDCFALCLSVLKRTGAYVRVFSKWPPGEHDEGSLDKWVADTQELGAKWRRSWIFDQPFMDLNTAWQEVIESFDLPLKHVNWQNPLCDTLIRLTAVADEASESVGAPLLDEIDAADRLLKVAMFYLQSFKTLCNEIDGTRLRVLPRMHTPQSGLTERSLSLYLSLYDPCEVVPEWLDSFFIEPESFNLLLIPWPFEVLVKQFRDATDSALTRLPEDFGFFAFDIEPGQGLTDSVMALYTEATRKLGRVDGIVLPEMAVSAEQFGALRAKLPQDCFIVSGVGNRGRGEERGTNEVRLSFPPHEEVVQKKHHPWKLTESQVVQYGLGGVLSPSIYWWEYAEFTDRNLKFITISADLVLAVLICEDLARPDPVANLVRTVGPNLVVALLMDGPQTKERWAARYATALADEPGCSVLSLTSRGMAQMSRPMAGPNRSRVIAIWKDRFAAAQEIELTEGCDAVAISLSTRYEEEFTADGRGDEGNAAYPVLSGVHPIRLKVDEGR